MSNNFVDNDNMTALMTAVGNKLSEKSKIFYGNETDWNNLTVAQKKEYDYWASPEDDGYTTSRIITKLWENPSPAAAFAAQNITLASDGYDFLLFIFLVLAGGRAVSVIVPKEQIGTMNSSYYSVADTSAYTTFVSRTFNFPSDTVVSFGDGNEQHGSSVRTTNNYRCVPYQIYGINMSVTPTSSEMDYSTDEQMIGHWIDGKPLYQKTIEITDFSAITSGARNWYSLYNSGDVKCDKVFIDNGASFMSWKDNGRFYLSGVNEYLIDTTNPPSYSAIRVFSLSGSIYVTLLNSGTSTPYKASYTDKKLVLTLKYTKTTD